MGRESRKLWPALAGTIVLIAAALVFGTLRLQAPVSGPAVSFGLAAIDDAIGSKAAPAYVRAIRDRYDQLIDALAGQGAAIILLPEKIALLSRAEAEPWQQHLAAKAAENHVWLAAGMGVDDGGKRVNLSWLFAPDGAQVGRYQKQHLAPPEREFIAGTAFELHAIGSRQYGIAICKDMHFASLARGYGQRQAAAMLVPAWDFYFDGWLAARMTAMRGVENGFMVIRASREGTLMVSDAYGRIIAEQPSRAMPGASLLVKATVAEPVATLYTRVGDAFAWLCLVAAAVLLVIGRRNPRNGVGEG
jgi:apolipoprotein N-acyltransferase